MLVLHRNTYKRQTITIETSDGTIVIKPLKSSVTGNMRLGFIAPPHVRILRTELLNTPKPEAAGNGDAENAA